jgi:hypothetical protein
MAHRAARGGATRGRARSWRRCTGEDAASALRSQIDALQRQIDEMKAPLQNVRGDATCRHRSSRLRRRQAGRSCEQFLRLADGPGVVLLVPDGGTARSGCRRGRHTERA